MIQHLFKIKHFIIGAFYLKVLYLLGNTFGGVRFLWIKTKSISGKMIEILM